MPEFTVIVATHNRADVLRETLKALSRLSYPGSWEVLVVDNNSTDHTSDVVAAERQDFPVPLGYLAEKNPGKYWALNAGIRATEGRFIVATDDDAFPERDWLERAEEGFRQYDVHFVGGPVYPVWGATPPRWVNPRDAVTGKVLGLQDHGQEPREYGCKGLSWPLGVNVAYRREAFDRVGFFDGRLGRVAGTLRNQSQREWHLRARAAGLRGMYLPRMIVHHSVEAHRLTRWYFYRWFYWHGVSRAIMYQKQRLHLLEPETGATHDGERHILGLPLSLWRKAARSFLSAGKQWLLGRPHAALQYELTLWFCAGVIRQAMRDRASAAVEPAGVGVAVDPQGARSAKEDEPARGSFATRTATSSTRREAVRR